MPSFEANADGNRQRDVLSEGSYSTTSKYSATVDAAYEVDLFGRIRSLKAQVLEKYFATMEAQRAAQIALIAEVAVQYLAERALDEELAYVQSALKSLKAYYRLIQSSYQLGQSSELDVRSAESQVEAARVDLANFKRQRAQASNALVLLVGQPLPDDLPAAQRLNSQRSITDIPPGLPSDLLQRRPDILEAEHNLKAANANIGAVRAVFFPRLILTASAGTASPELSDLFRSGTGVWSFVPQLNLPIFNRANNIANLDAAHVGKSIEIARYEKAVQTAFREVSEGLAAKQTYDQQIRAQFALVKAQQQRYFLADARYRNGIDSYLTVLLAQQDLYQARKSLIQSQFARLSNLVQLYKALGGGWQE